VTINFEPTVRPALDAIRRYAAALTLQGLDLSELVDWRMPNGRLPLLLMKLPASTIPQYCYSMDEYDRLRESRTDTPCDYIMVPCREELEHVLNWFENANIDVVDICRTAVSYEN